MTLASFAVKHIVKDYGRLASLMETVQRQPYSLTSKSVEARSAAKGCNVYVIEVIVESRKRLYRLGYRYRACECYESAGGTLWKGRFRFKNASNSSSPEGVYFEHSVLIEEPAFNDWYKMESHGMTKIPEKHVETLELLIAANASEAFPFFARKF
jgi:hypothetical protein